MGVKICYNMFLRQAHLRQAPALLGVVEAM
nr:MAG TPA: hypothetical protein [Caudoviricetes sp.]